MAHRHDEGHDEEPGEILIVDGKEYILTYHVKRRMEQRGVRIEWIYDVLTNWVARKFSKENNSMCYSKLLPEQKYLLMAAVSANRPAITTVHLDRDATETYNQRNADYFDEVRWQS